MHLGVFTIKHALTHVGHEPQTFFTLKPNSKRNYLTYQKINESGIKRRKTTARRRDTHQDDVSECESNMY